MHEYLVRIQTTDQSIYHYVIGITKMGIPHFGIADQAMRFDLIKANEIATKCRGEVIDPVRLLEPLP